MLLTMIPMLHQLAQEVNVFVGKGSIEKSLLLSKSVGSSANVSGRTLLQVAKEVLCKCKKMTAIVTASNSPYKDGNFPSRTNWDDYIKWCLGAMNKKTVTEKTAPSCVIREEAVEDCYTMFPADETERGEPEPDLHGNEEELYQNLNTFKGFMAWCLWGHIPIENDTNMKSLQFTDSKVATYHGRGTGLRRALKSAESLEDGVHLDNRRGTTKKQNRGSPKDDNEDTTTLHDDDTATTTVVGAEDKQDDRILKQALDYLDSESLEKARQKHSMLSCLRVRDEISSLKGQVDSVLRRFYHAKKGSPQAVSLMEKMDTIEAMLREREACLSSLQNEDADRQLKVIAERAALRAAAAAADSRQQRQPLASTAELQHDSGGIVFATPVKQTTPTNVVISFASPTKLPAEAMLAIATQEVLVCIECVLTPTTHKCRRCKRSVCDQCCFTKRGLEMIWWCAACFGKQSILNQETIRQGNYESDDDTSSI